MILTSFVRIVLLHTLLWMAAFTWAHEGEVHDKGNEIVKVTHNRCDTASEEIDAAFKQDVKQIFEHSCSDCHSERTVYPWYYRLPLIKGIIDQDIVDARKHLLVKSGFPFESHADPIEDFVAIAESIRSNSMPPLRYKALHWDSWLDKSEKNKIIFWAEESEKKYRSACIDAKARQ